MKESSAGSSKKWLRHLFGQVQACDEGLEIQKPGGWGVLGGTPRGEKAGVSEKKCSKLGGWGVLVSPSNFLLKFPFFF